MTYNLHINKYYLKRVAQDNDIIIQLHDFSGIAKRI